jgi:hypothetical protein
VEEGEAFLGAELLPPDQLAAVKSLAEASTKPEAEAAMGALAAAARLESKHALLLRRSSMDACRRLAQLHPDGHVLDLASPSFSSLLEVLATRWADSDAGKRRRVLFQHFPKAGGTVLCELAVDNHCHVPDDNCWDTG